MELQRHYDYLTQPLGGDASDKGLPISRRSRSACAVWGMEGTFATAIYLQNAAAAGAQLSSGPAGMFSAEAARVRAQSCEADECSFDASI